MPLNPKSDEASVAAENYLKAVYVLEADEGVATTSALAARLDVSAASASWMVKKGIPVFEVREESGWIAVRPRKPSEQDDDGA